MAASAQIQFQRFGRRTPGAEESLLYSEISEQPKSLAKTILFQRDQVQRLAKYLQDNSISSADVVAAGSSKNAAMVGSFFAGKLNLFVQEPSEYRQTSHTIFMVSQSGESSDLLRLLPLLQRKNAVIVTITNSQESTLSKVSRMQLFTHAKAEKAIAATGTMTAAVATFYHLGAELLGSSKQLLTALPEHLGRFLESIQKSGVGEVASSLKDKLLVTFLGQKALKWAAAESALKLGETAEVITTYGSMPMFRHGYNAAYGAKTEPAKSAPKAIFVLSSGCDQKIEAKYLQDGSANGFPTYLIKYGKGGYNAGEILIPAENLLEKAVFSIVFSQALAHDLAAEKGIEPGASAILTKVVK